MERKKISFGECWRLLKSKDYWIRVFRIGFPIMLIFDALKVISVHIIILTTLMHSSIPISIFENGLSVGFILSALLVLCGCIGLILKRNWARFYIFIVFLHYLVFWTLFQYYAFNSISIALLRTSLAVIIYFIFIYVYTRPKVRELFK